MSALMFGAIDVGSYDLELTVYEISKKNGIRAVDHLRYPVAVGKDTYTDGVISYEHEDGSRVGKSSVIARRFKSESDIRYRREIEQLEEQIAVLREAEKLIGTDTAQLETVTNEINEAHFAVASAAAAGD